MASKVKLETHQIEVRQRGNKNSEPLNLWNIDGQNLTFNVIFFRFLEWLDTAEHEPPHRTEPPTIRPFRYSARRDDRPGQHGAGH